MNRRTLLTGGGLTLATAAGVSWLGVRGMGSMTEYDAVVAQTRSGLSAQSGLHDLVRYATLAPNGHNTQPWRFRSGDRRIEILPDLSRQTPVVDPDDHHLFVSLGGAAENIVIAGSAMGSPGEISFDPTGQGGLAFDYRDGPARGSALCDAIPRRQSTRTPYDGRSVSVADLRTLAEAARLPGVDLVLITDRSGVNRVRDLVIEGNTRQLSDPKFVRELKSWVRFSPRQAMQTSDGLFSVLSGNPPLPAWLGPMIFDATFKAKIENDRYARQLDSSAGVAVFVGERADLDHWTRVGRASQRFALQATVLGLKIAHINPPVEVPMLRSALASVIGAGGRRPDLVMRFGYGPTLPFSARRPPNILEAGGLSGARKRHG